MKPVPVLVVAGLLVCAGILSARLVAVDDEAPDLKRYVLGLIYRVEGREDLDPEAIAKLQAGHLANIGRLVESGEMVLAGPFEGDGDLRGLFIYDVPTIERAEELVRTDPAVAAGRLRVELRAWWGTSLLAEMRELLKAGELHDAHSGDHAARDTNGLEHGDHDSDDSDDADHHEDGSDDDSDDDSDHDSDHDHDR